MLRNPVVVVIGLMLLAALALVGSMGYRAGPAADAPAPTVEPGARILRFGYNIPEDSALHLASVRFAEEVATRSKGRVQVQVFPAQQLGTDDQMLEMARRGELDIVLIPTAKVSVAEPAMQYADLPFYFPTREALYWMLDGEPGQMLLDKLRAIDLVGVTFWENGFKHFTGNRPLRSPEDFAGLDVRIMKSRMLMEQFQAFGAHAIPIDFHATRQALLDGVVDAQENPLVAIVSMGLHEVQTHLTLSSHGYLGYVFMISSKVFDGLPADVQDLLLNTARELTPWERDETHRREQTLLDTIRLAGVTVNELNADERARFATATAHIPERFEDVIGADILARTEELLDAAKAGGERIVIGLDVDLSRECVAAGLGFRRGARLAIDEINAAGGVLGKPLKLITRNHHAQPTAGAANFDHFASRPDVAAVITGVQSGVVMAQAEVARRTGLPLLAAWSAEALLMAEAPAGDPVFRVSANDTLVAPYLADHLLSKGPRPAIVFENSVWGRGNLDAMRGLLRARGLDFQLALAINRGDENFTAIVQQLAATGVDSVLFVATPHAGGHFVRALAAQGLALPVVSHWGISCDDFWKQHREALAKVDLSFFQTFSFIDNPRLPARRLAGAYMARYGVDNVRAIPVPQAVAHAYDLVHLLALAIERAGSTERVALRQALEQLPPHEGAVRHYAPAFSPERHDALDTRDFRIAQFADDGAIVELPRPKAAP